MGSRPAPIETRSRSHGPLGAGSDPLFRPQPSPRLHVAGEVPPELSPLDAFAAQSRLLAKKLEEGTKGGKRMSRLPPLSMESAFMAPRPALIRSASVHDAGDAVAEPHSSSLAMKLEVESASLRPISVHPRMSKIPSPGPLFNISHSQNRDEEAERGRKPLEPHNTIDTRKQVSSKLIGQPSSSRVQNHAPSLLAGHNDITSISQQHRDSFRYDVRSLAPPRSPFSQKILNPRSTSLSDSDEDLSASIAPSERLNSRKFSSSSVLSTSPSSPFLPRSSSVCSDLSSTNNRLSRPAFNFSRPLSRASEAPGEIPLLQASADIDQVSFINDAGQGSLVTLPGVPPTDTLEIASPSSIHSTFSLSQRKMPLRDSLISPELEQTYPSPLKVKPQNPEANSKPAPFSPSLPFAPHHEHQLSSETSDPKSDQASAITSRVIGLDTEVQDLQVGEDRAMHSSPNEINAPPLLNLSSSPHAGQEINLEGSAEWHVTKGIDCHERGSLNESTYHLRTAARLNHPTGMLLYALACRHGWGMRPNQQEGVQWLRRAADLAILEVTDDENSVKGGKVVDFVDKKTRKAQFALSIYELGVSHLNGWGIEQDKALALRCFEIAGAWGDGDALAEAGFCYAQGIGCKKDLKRSAKFYHMAESKGISMVGNSWIYKSKYKDDTSDRDMSRPKKPLNKSQPRSIFARKKSSP